MSLDTNHLAEAPVVAAQGGVTSINHWPRLSDEMVLIILRHLPLKDLVKVSEVSKKFRDLSRDDSLWTELTLDYRRIELKAESRRKLVERCKKLAILKISNKVAIIPKINIMTMTVVIRAKDTLKRLEIDSSKQTWTPAAMTKLGQLKNLTCLTMNFNTEELAGAKLLEELARLEKLEVLKLRISNNTSVHPRTDSLPAMKTVFEKLKKLKDVEISLPDFDVSLVVTLGKNNPDLTGLHLVNYPPLSDETINVLADSCPGLQEFSISFANGDREISKLSSSFPDLKRLFIKDCYYEPRSLGDRREERLVTIVEKFRRLEGLHLTGTHRPLTDSGIEKIVGAAAAKNLKYLRVDRATRVTKALVERMRMEYPGLTLRINNY